MTSESPESTRPTLLRAHGGLTDSGPDRIGKYRRGIGAAGLHAHGYNRTQHP